MRKAPLLQVTAQLAIGFRGTKLGGSAFDKSDGEFPSSPSPSRNRAARSRQCCGSVLPRWIIVIGLLVITRISGRRSPIRKTHHLAALIQENEKPRCYARL